MKRLTFISICLFAAIQLIAQAPQGFKYQTALRDVNGLVLANKLVSIKASLLAGSASANAIYEETHSIATNEFGIASLNIGQGTTLSGAFATIDWGANTYYLKIDLDVSGGSNYVFMGTTQLLSVPYAMYAQTAGNASDDMDKDTTNEIQNLTLNGNTIGITNGNTIVLPPDNDADTTNEIQTIALQGNTLSISKGNSIVLSGAVDLDSDPTNELQTLSILGDTISISGKNKITLPVNNDRDSLNELQVLSLSNDTLRLSKGNYVVINNDSLLWQKNGPEIFSLSTSVGIGTNNPNNSSVLDLTSTNKGFLAPRMTVYQRDLIPNPAIGLQIFNTTTNCLNIFIGTNWQELCGTCTPVASQAYSGKDTIFTGISYALQATAPIYGEVGFWKKISGNGGSFSDTLNPSAIFTGIVNTNYVLQWVIKTSCNQTTDNLNISLIDGTIVVGANYQGGIIFYVDDTKCHGLIASVLDYDDVNDGSISNTHSWGCQGFSIVTGVAIGTGLQNTINIVNNCSSIKCAAYLCYNHIYNGYDDWYLPSYSEFLELLKIKALLNLNPSYYNTSSEYDLNRFKALTGDDGANNNLFKNGSNYTRPIRAF